MAFYVRRWPDNCDPRTACFGVKRGRRNTPKPWRWYSKAGAAGVPLGTFQYDGIWGTGILLPSFLLTSVSPGDEADEVVWEEQQVITIGTEVDVDVIVRMRKLPGDISLFDEDSLFTEMELNTLLSDESIEYVELPTEQSGYVSTTLLCDKPEGCAHRWFDGETEIHQITGTTWWPTKWDDLTPGPPFVP